MKKVGFLCGILCLALSLSAQQQPLPQVEKRLQQLADSILNISNLQAKIAANKRFSSLLIDALKRPESFTYGFDSLRTISKLRPEDNTFRIFTWHIMDENPQSQYHYYFGLVQRKYTPAGGGETQYIVIPLIEMPQVPRAVENMMLDNNSWFGAQYYPAKDQELLPGYTMRFHLRPKSSTEPPKEVKNTFYLLMGWNGNDETSNFKVIDILAFDPEKPDRVLFGADVFYFDVVPKSRAIFKYSENAPFTLNTAYVKTAFGKRRMIVFDHLSAPNKSNSPANQSEWEIGPDGTYDAIVFENKTKKVFSSKQNAMFDVSPNKGYFEWSRNITLAEKYNTSQNQKLIEERRYASLKDELGEKEARRVAHEMSVKESRDDAALAKKLREQQAYEAERLKKAGISLDKKKKKP